MDFSAFHHGRPWCANIRFLSWWLFTIPVFIACFSPSVFAYVIPAWRIVQMMQEKNKPVQNLQVSRQTVLFDRIFPAGKLEVREELYLDGVNGFRVEMKLLSGQKIFIDDGQSSITVVNNKIVAKGSSYGSLLQLLFSTLTQEDIHQALTRMGINQSLVSLGRMSGRVVIIIGAEQGDMGKPQLWVDKELLLPVRFIGPDHLYRDGSFVVQDFSDHYQADDAIWLPKIIRAFDGSALVRTSVVLQAYTNVPTPPEFFNISHVMAAFPYAKPQNAEKGADSLASHENSPPFPIPDTQGDSMVDVDRLFTDFQSIFR